MRGGGEPDAGVERVRHGALDPSLEVFPDRPVRGTLREGDDDRPE
jgi:hypothetical protein